MDTNTLKSAIVGGYQKSSVIAMLDELAATHATELAALSEEKGKLLDQIALLEEKIAALESDVSGAAEEKSYVASAIVSAEKEAAKILDAATKEADALKESTKNELASVRSEITELRRMLHEAAKTCEKYLDDVAAAIEE